MSMDTFAYKDPETFVFPSEALRRYFLWSGADVFVALHTSVGIEDEPDYDVSGFMPRNEATGAPHDAESFFEIMKGFSAVLAADGFRPADFLAPDPYFFTNEMGDVVRKGRQAEIPGDPVTVGLTGERQAGKSFLSKQLEEIGFLRVHPFNPGKALLRGYYVSRGADERTAWEMTDGSLKDVPAPDGILPVDHRTGKAVTSRYVMEELGKFMAKTVGLDSTLGRELAHWSGSDVKRLLVDSVVYEADFLRAQEGAVILDLQVPADKRPEGPEILAHNSNEHVARIVADARLVNTMEGAERLMDDFHAALASCGVHLEPIGNDSPEPGA